MKYLAFIFFVISIFSCTNSDGDFSCLNHVEYNTEFKATDGMCYAFDDGTELNISRIVNGFCPPWADCIWEGEMSISIVWSFANGEILEYTYHGNGIVIPNEDLPLGLVFSHDSESLSFENACDTSVEQCDIISVNITVAN